MIRFSHFTSFSSVQSTEESETNLRPVLQRLPVERGDWCGNGEVPRPSKGTQRRWSAVWGEMWGVGLHREAQCGKQACSKRPWQRGQSGLQVSCMSAICSSAPCCSLILKRSCFQVFLETCVILGLVGVSTGGAWNVLLC